MAKQIIHRIVDDLDGGEADETVRFSLDGVQYEIDLSNKNAGKLRDLLAPYVARGAKVGRVTASATGGGRAVRPRGSAAVDREQNRAIREWAKKAGREISDRGRIPQEIVDEYHAQAGR